MLGGEDLPEKVELPTPDHNGERLTLGSVRLELRDVQRKDPRCRAIIEQIAKEQDPNAPRRKQLRADAADFFYGTRCGIV